MKGKDKCRALKEIRNKIANENDIDFVTKECTYQGECKGTCPKCEAELRFLEEQLEKRKHFGKKVVLAGISTGMAASFCACSVPDTVTGIADFISDTASDLVDGVENIFDDGFDNDSYEGGISVYIPPENNNDYELQGDVINDSNDTDIDVDVDTDIDVDIDDTDVYLDPDITIQGEVEYCPEEI